MSDTHDLSGWIGRTVVDVNGVRIGILDNIFMDEDTQDAEWFAVTTDNEGEGPYLVPLAGASPKGDTIALIYTTERVKDSPKVQLADEIDDAQEAKLYAYYEDKG